MILNDLAGKLVVITGASTGIGAAAAKSACRARRDNCRTLQPKRGGGAASCRGEARRVVDASADALGGIDVLVNNAGSLIQRTPFEELSDELIDNIIDLNIRSVITASQAAVPHLERRGGGSIINVGSIAGVAGGGPGAAAYGAAKSFVHNLTRHLAGLLAPKNIRVNAVAPGVIATPFHAATPPERMEAMRQTIPMGRVGKAEDVAGAFLYLASERMSGYVTGQIIHVNGGQLMA